MKKKTIVLNDAQINVLLSLLNKELSLCDLSSENCRSSCYEGLNSIIYNLNHPLIEFYEEFEKNIESIASNYYASSNKGLSKSGDEANR